MFRAVRGRCLPASRSGLQWLRQAGTSPIQRVTSSLGGPVSNGKVLALRREDNSEWERRAPLSPSQVQQLVKSGIKVIVQPSNRRAFPMQVTIPYTLHGTILLFALHFRLRITIWLPGQLYLSGKRLISMC